jgi:DNA polymerase-1
MGDSSDNIPGVPGIGQKTAASLLQQYETMDGIYENLWQIKDSVRRKLEDGKELADMSKKVAELWFDAPVELDLKALDTKDLDTKKLKELLIKLEFRSLLRNLPEHMQSADDVVTGPDNVSFDAASEMKEGSAKAQLTMAEYLVVWPDGDDVWLSHEKGKAAKMSRKSAIEILSATQLVGHDTKVFMKQLLADGVVDLPVIRHDTAQGSFLLNPLRKSRELADLVGLESIDDPKLAITAVWALFEEQTKALAALPKLSHVAHDIDFALIPVLARMEFAGITLDVAKLATMQGELAKTITQIEKDMYELVGHEFNIASPAQLSEVLFTELQLPTAMIKKGKTAYSTGQKELDKLRGQHPIIELIEQFRELTKLQNTYVETLPKTVDEASKIHTVFNQDVAATGRLSSADPNLQNIPIRTDMGRRIREAFVPASGNVFVSADYSQFELRLAAVLAGEEKMINDFNAGTDIHAKTVSEVYKIPLDAVTKDQRRAAKVINFGVLYGMSSHGLAAASGLSFIEAKQFIDEYFRVRPKVRKYIDDTVKKAHDEGYVETLFGRRRPTPDVKSSNFVVRQAAERAAANMPIQGTEADLMKMAMLEVDKKIDGRGVQLLQIHDSILVECPKENAEAISELLVDTMENIYPELGVKLQVDVHTGKNWGEV